MAAENPTDPFDAEAFRSAGHAFVDELADHLQRTGRREGKVLDLLDPAELRRRVPALGPSPHTDVHHLLAQLLAHSNRLHHPRYVGHQVCPPLPEIALFEAANALLNNGMAVYEMGPMQTVMEEHAIRWMCARAGLPEAADGLLTSGGSLGNLTALSAARRRARLGGAETSAMTVVVSDQSHYCIQRACGLLGLGPDAPTVVATGPGNCLDPDDVDACLQRLKAQGKHPIALVANACTTATGSFDPLAELSEVARRHDCWLHVDGAHGASYCLLPEMQSRLAGLGQADSIVWDAHKMLQVPALVTAVLFADGRWTTAHLEQHAPYLFDPSTEPPWYDRGTRTIECTKRALGVLIYATVATVGEPRLCQDLRHGLALARDLADRIDASEDFELAIRPDCNIVCFRHVPHGVADLDTHNRALRRKLLAAGRVYVVQTTLSGSTYLRTTLINPRTTEQDLADLLDHIREIAADESAARDDRHPTR